MVNLIKKNSGIHGFGLFAGENITKDRFLIEYEGQRISKFAAEVREQMYIKKGVTYLFNLDSNTVIDGGVDGNLSIFINHSCDPNCIAKIEDRRVNIYSLRKIKKGEEMTFDYNFSKSCMREYCNCGSEKCRRYINAI